MAVAKDHEKNLETLSLFISMDVRNAMMASYVTFVADRWFYQYSEEDQRKLFRTNPANTLTYASLNALFERSVVHMSEVLKDEHGIHRITVEIRRKVDPVSYTHLRSPASVASVHLRSRPPSTATRYRSRRRKARWRRLHQRAASGW